MWDDLPLLYKIAGIVGVGIMLLDLLFLIYIFSADGMRAGREVFEDDEAPRVDLDKVVSGCFGERR